MFLGIGVFLLMQVVSPFLAYKTWEIFAYDSSQLLADPKSLNGHSGGRVLGVSVSSINDVPVFISSRTGSVPYPEFSLTIPRLKLANVKVRVSSNDFEQNLAQLPGTALPGERGNVFVSGHSSIARNFELQDQKAFFANLPNIKKGDEVYVEAVGQRYTYEVIGTQIVDPKDTEVINPPDNDGRYLTLMTCVPPGFNTKRLIVLARMKQ